MRRLYNFFGTGESLVKYHHFPYSAAMTGAFSFRALWRLLGGGFVLHRAAICVTLITLCIADIATSSQQQTRHEPHTAGSRQGCLSCHPISPDTHHQFGCTQCHGGNPDAVDGALAHVDLIARPAHPDHAEAVCGGCHIQETAMVKDNPHYTLTSHITLVRHAFDPAADEIGLSELSAHDSPGNGLELVDDALRRRCLRCHIYNNGEAYPLARHGAGCAACHLGYDGERFLHQFSAPVDMNRCLSCHYANHVGFDYVGRFERDFHDEYRVPYDIDVPEKSAYGVGFQRLSDDLHHQAGLVCIDCHTKHEVMGSGSGPECSSCHDGDGLALTLPARVEKLKDGYRLRTSSDNSFVNLVLMAHPAHERYNDEVACQVCHGQWSFNDKQTHLMRIDHEFFDEFERIGAGGSREVETQLGTLADVDGDFITPTMRDPFTGEVYRGMWLKGYYERRWEELLLAPDAGGKLQVVRPLLDLYISWVDGEERVRFDNLVPDLETSRYLPYTPHTTGHAGMFWQQRLRGLDQGEQDSIEQ
jgi:hypothetical protein